MAFSNQFLWNFFFCHSAVTTSVTASLKYFKAHCLLLFLNVFFLSLLRWAIRLDEVPAASTPAAIRRRDDIQHELDTLRQATEWFIL